MRKGKWCEGLELELKQLYKKQLKEDSKQNLLKRNHKQKRKKKFLHKMIANS